MTREQDLDCLCCCKLCLPNLTNLWHRENWTTKISRYLTPLEGRLLHSSWPRIWP